MSLTAPGGENEAPDLDAVDPGETRSLGDLTERIVNAAYLEHPRLHRALVIVLVVLTGTCVVAVASRLSPLPLLPVPLFLVAGFALHRVRAVPEGEHRPLLVWSGFYLAATIVGFWLISVVGRWLE
ncbi:hypothetical protein [Amycolatopsis sp. H20-H5]|uniref:hypothetical protein n=1 Tax=Amycolatopsis sp. H20-H5 TaxID=3046309 RepID=UPI002DBFE208|nr:hypothetical protein [Amycolatopsis sp. H20-H5]MEC3979107.1 hypothetical protein [Amycolatopsis sp. H20-H5]